MRFEQVDVFSGDKMGNPLAVVIDAQGLTDTQMADFARWTNLSETTFLLPPTDPAANYWVRIFTPTGEIPFAGHPTLGSAYVWANSHNETMQEYDRECAIVQQCGIGLVDIRQFPNGYGFIAPEFVHTAQIDAGDMAMIMEALALDSSQIRASRVINIGLNWTGILLNCAATVLAVKPNFSLLAQHKIRLGLAGAHPDGQLEVRGFAPYFGVNEDPVTGSLNAGLARWLISAGFMPENYIAVQGRCIGRLGRVEIASIEGEIWIIGQVRSIIEGTITQLLT